MKKSLLALAVLGAFAGAAAAQTNVTMYGIADAGVGVIDTDPAQGSSTFEVLSGTNSGSRLGLRGSEDLGGGLKAMFNIEGAVNYDTGRGDETNGMWARRAVVGLSGGFGEVRLGRDYSVGFTSSGIGDVMSYGLFNNWATATGAGGLPTRVNNGIHYTSPSFGGLSVRAMYVTGETPDAYAGGVQTDVKGDGDAYGLAAVYAAGPLSLQAFYHSFQVANATSTDTNTDDQYGIGAAYNMGMFRFGANYLTTDRDNGDEYQAFGLGAGIKVGVGEVLVTYIDQEWDRAAAATEEGKSWGLAYLHPLSKRTNLYATYGQMRNNDAGQFGLASATRAAAAAGRGSDPKALAVGIRHMF